MATDTLPMDFGRDKPIYVYLYRDPRPGKHRQPIYVGKGTAKHGRADEHWRKKSHNRLLQAILNKIKAADLVPEIEIVAWFDEEIPALEFEATLIKRIGRRNMGEGPLANLRDRDVGVGRVIRTPEFRAAKSVLMKSLSVELWADNAMRAKMLAGGPSYTQTARYKAEKSVITKSKWTDPDHRNMRRARMKAAASKPDRRAKLLAMIHSFTSDPEALRRRGETLRARNLSQWKWEIDGVLYDSAADAAAANGVGIDAIYWRVRNGRGKKVRYAPDHESLPHK